MYVSSVQVYKATRDGVQDVAVKKLKVDATASGVQAFLEVCPRQGRKPIISASCHSTCLV
jgi:hypothetical protein